MFRTVFKSARAVIALSLVGGVGLAAVVGWATGFFASAAGTVAGLWSSLVGWINSPLSWEHLLAGAGVLLVPVVILVLIFVIADD
ncbi:hypothetical protein ACF08M_12920 [Streptomyces sp. NPDC015032]|uniref:hypothetical protein n=1 Tax=Streptomyces sp. NPDC015032 TaxID=3364937 RepID=UPI0036FD741F